MFRRKVKEDPTELQLLKIRVQNLEKQIAEMKRAPQVQAEEQEKVFDEWYQKAKKIILEDITNGNRTIPEKSSFIPL